MKHTFKVAPSGDREIVITRDFDAPRELVWDTMSKPELLRRWVLGPPGWEMTVCEEDARVGGQFRWAWAGPEGAALSMSGEYLEINRPEKVVRTEKFDVGTGHPEMVEQLATLELAEDGPRTRLMITLQYPSKEARDGAVASGMEHGMAASYDRLDDVLQGVSV
ncbi:SRPBCC family protein [Singulisphaera sp. PoT]|uniref:SRPBCC family protein n=1 Tax=Singulisphaera sp. PoT TaxID=3411797 RepID=UPI003BF51E6E